MWAGASPCRAIHVNVFHILIMNHFRKQYLKVKVMVRAGMEGWSLCSKPVLLRAAFYNPEGLTVRWKGIFHVTNLHFTWDS